MSLLLQVMKDNKNAGRSKAFFDYLFKVSKDKGIPFSGTFELTPRCTLNCPMCYVRLSGRQMRKAELTTRQWIGLIEQAAKAGMMHARVTGGECFLHPGFREIFMALEDLGIFTKILTNATLLDEKTITWIARRPVEVIQVSVYGNSPEMYRATTGNARAFHAVDRALDMLRESGLPFEISITASKQLAPHVEDIYSYCQEKAPMAVRFSPNPIPSRPETGKRTEDFQMSLEETVAYYHRFYRLTGRTVSRVDAANEETPNENCQSTEQACSALPKEGILCAAGKAVFCIKWDGTLVPCSAIDFIRADPLRVGFQSAWQEIRDAASAYHYPSECVRCGVRQKCVACPAVHPASTLNTAQCDETRRFLREGLI